jgi:hypothetical protein
MEKKRGRFSVQAVPNDLYTKVKLQLVKHPKHSTELMGKTYER